MALMKVLRRGQVTLPRECREALRIAEGDILEVSIHGSNMVIKPRPADNKTESLSAQGVQRINEALEEYRSGKTKTFDTVKDLLKDLGK